MTEFEFVFGLISVITSLALTHIVVALMSFARRGRRVRFSLRHALWVWTAFALVIANWAAYWRMRETDWQAHTIFIGLAQMIGLYAFSALIIPETQPGDEIDLASFHDREGRRYIAAHAVFAVLVIVGFAINATSIPEWLAGSSFAWIALSLTAAAFVARPVRLQQIVAAALAALATYFMVLRIDAVGA